MAETKFRISELESEFMVVKNIMWIAGVEFSEIPSCHFLELLNALRVYYQAVNPEIESNCSYDLR